MPAEIVTAFFCASWDASYTVEGSGGNSYDVRISPEGRTWCSCPAYKHFRGEEYDRTCKHIKLVHNEACLWNPQWPMPSQERGEVLRQPTMVSTRTMVSERCPQCGGPVVAVRIAI